MRRTQIYLEDQQDHRLTERSRQVGRTKSDLIREAIDSYLRPAGSDDDGLARFHAAVRAAAGIAPYLPPGAEYVEELRAAEAKRRAAQETRR